MSRYAVASWHLVVPVKGGPLAKSRLHPPPGVSRADLAEAVALDTLDAVAAALPPTRLTVVTSDRATSAHVHAIGARLLPDPGAGLAAAIAAGVASLAATPMPAVGVLLGDLPALRPEELATALRVATGHPRAFVPDAQGTGTVLLTALPGWPLRPAFGPDSAAAHERDSVRLDLDLPTLRTDVDDDAALAAAATLGLGRRTAELLRAAAG